MSTEPTHSTVELPLGPDDTPKIKVVFRGFIVTHIKHGEPQAMVGALDPSLDDGTPEGIPDAPCHKPFVYIYQIDSKGVTTDITNSIEGFPIDVSKDFSLNVLNTHKIEVFQKDEEEPFNRLDEVENDKKDFRWFVNLNELHNKKEPEEVKILLEKLKPKFILNSGVFHASKLSDGEVMIHRVGHPVKRFGRFAFEITARIRVAADDLVILRNGANTHLIPGGDPHRYEIVFDCTCRSDQEQTSDFNLIYEVIRKHTGGKFEEKDMVRLEPPRVAFLTQEEIDELRKKGPFKPRCTPEVYCQGGNG